jgi:hypothetical protein
MNVKLKITYFKIGYDPLNISSELKPLDTEY